MRSVISVPRTVLCKARDQLGELESAFSLVGVDIGSALQGAGVALAASRSQVVVLAPYWSTAGRTFEMLLRAAAAKMPGLWRSSYLRRPEEVLRLRRDVGQPRGCRWEALQFERWDPRSPSRRYSYECGHGGVLACLLLHPNVFKLLSRPVFLDGYEVSAPSFAPWSLVPVVEWNQERQRIEVGVGHADRRWESGVVVVHAAAI
jgi:hypothetical protein